SWPPTTSTHSTSWPTAASSSPRSTASWGRAVRPRSWPTSTCSCRSTWSTATAASPSRSVDVVPPQGDTGRAGGYQVGSETRGEVEEATMPQQAWSTRRDRQYEHIKEGLE